jgi:hypothetical protein
MGRFLRSGRPLRAAFGIRLVTAATIAIAASGYGDAAQGATTDAPINTLKELFVALQACWIPPPLDRAHDGMEITVRFSLTRDGRVLGKAAIKFESPDASEQDRLAYRQSIIEAFGRCAPFPITVGLGNAIAGRPFAIRFIDSRRQKQAGMVEGMPARVRSRSYGHFATGGIEERMESTLPPVLSPNTVPRSYRRLNST